MLFKKEILSVIRSNIDKKNITADAKAIPPIKKFRVLFLGMNIIKAPIIVESPAILERINAKQVFMLSPINYMFFSFVLFVMFKKSIIVI